MRIVGYAKAVGRFIYATEDEIVRCSSCSRPIEYGCSMIVHWTFSEHHAGERVFCPSCADVSRVGVQDQVFPAVLVGVLPDGFLIVPKKALDMRIAGDTFSLALSNKGISAECADTSIVYDGIGPQSWEGSAIGMNMDDVDAERDRRIDIKDVEPHILRLSHENTFDRERGDRTKKTA